METHGRISLESIKLVVLFGHVSNVGMSKLRT